MDSSLHLVILAQPGHSRDSLVALLKTLRPAGLFPLSLDDLWAGGAEQSPASSAVPATILLVDLVSLGTGASPALLAARQRWPEARVLALVETIRLSNGTTKSADVVLHRSVSAGELLAAVQHLAHTGPRLVAESTAGPHLTWIKTAPVARP